MVTVQCCWHTCQMQIVMGMKPHCFKNDVQVKSGSFPTWFLLLLSVLIIFLFRCVFFKIFFQTFPLKCSENNSVVSRWKWISLFGTAVKHYLKCQIYPQPIFQMYSNYGLLFLPVIKNYNPCLLSFFPFGLSLCHICFSFLPCMSFILHLPLIWSGKINNL